MPALHNMPTCARQHMHRAHCMEKISGSATSHLCCTPLRMSRLKCNRLVTQTMCIHVEGWHQLEQYMPWLQDGPASIRLHAQQLRRLPGIGSAALPMSPAMQHIMRYPHPAATALAAAPTTLLYSGSGCAKPRCGPLRVTAAVVLVDEAADAATALLPNVALSSWVRQVLGAAGATGAATLWDRAAARLLTAAADSADLDSISSDTWLKVVAAPAATGTVRGVWNTAECVRGSGDGAGCECVVHVPSLFSPDLFGIPQVPVVMLDLPLKRGAPAEVGHRVLAEFRALLSDGFGGQRLCVSTIANTEAGAAAACVPDESGPGGPGPAPPQPCESAWALDVYRGRCARTKVSGMLTPVRPVDTSPVMTRPVAAVDVAKVSCAEVFPGFPPDLAGSVSCAAWSTHVCLSEAQLLRISVSAHGTEATYVSLAVNGATFAAGHGERGVERAAGSKETVWAAAVLPLASGCHSVDVVYEQPTATDTACVRSCLACCYVITFYTSACVGQCGHRLPLTNADDMYWRNTCVWPCIHVPMSVTRLQAWAR